MRVADLAVHGAEFPLLELMTQRNQRNFAGILCITEHGLTKKHPANRQTVNTTYQTTINPRLHGVGDTKFVQLYVSPPHFVGYPGAFMIPSWFCAGPDNPLKIAIAAKVKLALVIASA